MLSHKEITAARQADLVQYLRDQGYDLQREGQNWRIEGHGGLLIRQNHWKQFNTGEGGNAVDFLTKVLGKDFRTAVQELVNITTVTVTEPTEKKLKMPQPAANQRRVIAYLNQTRGLPANLVVSLIRAGLLYQDGRGNCVFPCFEDGQARGAILHGTLTDVRYTGRAPGSDIRHGWYWPPEEGNSDLLTVSEAPIDAMSLSVLRPKCRKGHILALGGLHREAIESFLSRFEIRRAVLALDNDFEGQKVAQNWREWLFEKYQVWNLVSQQKDWNEDLKKGIQN